MGGVLSSTSASNPNDSHSPTFSSSNKSCWEDSPHTSATLRMSNSDSLSPKSEENAGVKETLQDQASSSLVESIKLDDGGPERNFGESEMVEEDGGEIGQEEGQEEEEEGECGFCLFMKGGGCKESFVAWELCIEEAEKNKEDIVEKCFQATSALKKCMEANSDYYEPILRAENNAEEEAMKQLKEEAESNESKQDAVDSEKTKNSRDSEGKASGVDK